MARSLASDLGTAGMVVVSGLARGIDAAAHLAALDTGTIAIQAGGVDVMYPVENTVLAHQIAEQGLRLSEQPMGLQPTARHFPRRNRIISGLSRATIVIEAAARSGSLITARDALDQGREVMAVPGHPLDARSSGCNMLIRDGAMLVRTARDVLEVIGTEGETHPQARAQSRGAAMPAATPTATPSPKPRSLADLHKRILSLLGASPIAEDQLIRDLRAPAAEVAPALMDLELEGHVIRRPGGLLTRTI
ncbi:DNA protecting protein DprA [Sulfitobacter brevis]|uniref:DNA protecting protein DprA n=1 Tax=Sulfitobacter brevis TaxID=74348 RepID=A0A1I2BQ90_9RHOB|nr:DNA protecting protein DprA [Sulfitobacter brevis]